MNFRYLNCFSLESRVTHQRLVRIYFADYAREIAIVAEHGKGTARKLVAVGRLNRLRDGAEAEFALVVSDAWQGRGLGTRLLETLIGIARPENIERITGTILQANHTMLHICRRAGFRLESDSENCVVTADLAL